MDHYKVELHVELYPTVTQPYELMLVVQCVGWNDD